MKKPKPTPALNTGPQYHAGNNVITNCHFQQGHTPESIEAIKMIASALEENANALGLLAGAMKPSTAPMLVLNGTGPGENDDDSGQPEAKP